MQQNVLKKWNITAEQLKEACQELCAKGVGKGCYQNTNDLLAALDLLTKGDIPEEEQ